MTKDDIMKLAREAGWDAHHAAFDTRIEAFYNLVAAAELRRLHKVNQELLEALKDATEGLEIASAGGGVDFYAYAKTLRAAINKVEGDAA